MRVLICGSRDFKDYEKICYFMSGVIAQGYQPTVVISGTASGADTLGEKWAAENKVAVERYPANWTKYHKAAGPIRNQQMLDAKPDLIFGFPTRPEDIGNGTKDMLSRGCKVGIPTFYASGEEWIRVTVPLKRTIRTHSWYL